jgi:hypothetical protein
MKDRFIVHVGKRFTDRERGLTGGIFAGGGELPFKPGGGLTKRGKTE